MRTLIYSLRNVDDRTVLSIDLTGKIIAENIRSITMQLPTGTIEILKENWINRDRIYDDGKVFFLVVSKHRKTEHVKNILIEYAIRKLDTRAAHIEAMRNKLKSELIAA